MPLCVKFPCHWIGLQKEFHFLFSFQSFCYHLFWLQLKKSLKMSAYLLTPCNFIIGLFWLVSIAIHLGDELCTVPVWSVEMSCICHSIFLMICPELPVCISRLCSLQVQPRGSLMYFTLPFGAWLDLNNGFLCFGCSHSFLWERLGTSHSLVHYIMRNIYPYRRELSHIAFHHMWVLISNKDFS